MTAGKDVEKDNEKSTVNLIEDVLKSENLVKTYGDEVLKEAHIFSPGTSDSTLEKYIQFVLYTK